MKDIYHIYNFVNFHVLSRESCTVLRLILMGMLAMSPMRSKRCHLYVQYITTHSHPIFSVRSSCHLMLAPHTAWPPLSPFLPTSTRAPGRGVVHRAANSSQGGFLLVPSIGKLKLKDFLPPRYLVLCKHRDIISGLHRSLELDGHLGVLFNVCAYRSVLAVFSKQAC